MDTSPPLPSTQSWPLERGFPLFVAWTAGLILSQVLADVVMNMLIFKGIASFSDLGSDWKLRAQFTIVPVALAAWQAWLLFRKHPARFACWTLLPLTGIFLPPTAKMAGYMGLVAPIIHAAILRGVRQRAWAWILAGMAGVILSQLSFWFVYIAGGEQWIDRLVGNIVSDPTNRLAAAMKSGVLRGIWIVGQAISAAVLAWKMPPVISAERVAETDP